MKDLEHKRSVTEVNEDYQPANTFVCEYQEEFRVRRGKRTKETTTKNKKRIRKESARGIRQGGERESESSLI